MASHSQVNQFPGQDSDLIPATTCVTLAIPKLQVPYLSQNFYLQDVTFNVSDGGGGNTHVEIFSCDKLCDRTYGLQMTCDLWSFFEDEII
jgi:hypothetical protein